MGKNESGNREAKKLNSIENPDRVRLMLLISRGSGSILIFLAIFAFSAVNFAA
jgi:hypothetical protein